MNKRGQARRGRTLNKASRGLSASTSKALEVWPPKYKSKYEPLKEIPKDCVKELLLAMDKDLDGKVSFDELVTFVNTAAIQSFSLHLLESMFKEVASRRSIITEADRYAPITFNELFFCCKVVC
eukprot:TRINITY_DN2133_c0_g2_i4.p1 TRINITY_DN2133_c0_g2~~TRINITY_DN2133_c0_g2_i4.p1  ORF type:complete len:124 (-),score=20.02 TRINITY_DN2133_c0_g2_i4:774-1145(-)